MGLMVHSLGELPPTAERGYYVYLLDYGWDEPMGEVLAKNFNKMAAIASANDAVVIRGSPGSDFQDEVLSWHHINGEAGDDLLPAILITTRHPSTFREAGANPLKPHSYPSDGMILIPIRAICKTSNDVVSLVDGIFRDIREKKTLDKFQVKRQMNKGFGGALVDAVILQPNLSGLGVDIKMLFEHFNHKKKSQSRG